MVKLLSHISSLTKCFYFENLAFRHRQTVSIITPEWKIEEERIRFQNPLVDPRFQFAEANTDRFQRPRALSIIISETRLHESSYSRHGSEGLTTPLINSARKISSWSSDELMFTSVPTNQLVTQYSSSYATLGQLPTTSPSLSRSCLAIRDTCLAEMHNNYVRWTSFPMNVRRSKLTRISRTRWSISQSR